MPSQTPTQSHVAQKLASEILRRLRAHWLAGNRRMDKQLFLASYRGFPPPLDVLLEAIAILEAGKWIEPDAHAFLLSEEGMAKFFGTR